MTRIETETNTEPITGFSLASEAMPALENDRLKNTIDGIYSAFRHSNEARRFIRFSTRGGMA
jgi:hypothetical protein